jgi:hypothetical protein
VAAQEVIRQEQAKVKERRDELNRGIQQVQCDRYVRMRVQPPQARDLTSARCMDLAVPTLFAGSSTRPRPTSAR